MCTDVHASANVNADVHGMDIAVAASVAQLLKLCATCQANVGYITGLPMCFPGMCTVNCMRVAYAPAVNGRGGGGGAMAVATMAEVMRDAMAVATMVAVARAGESTKK